MPPAVLYHSPGIVAYYFLLLARNGGIAFSPPFFYLPVPLVNHPF